MPKTKTIDVQVPELQIVENLSPIHHDFGRIDLNELRDVVNALIIRLT